MHRRVSILLAGAFVCAAIGTVAPPSVHAGATYRFVDEQGIEHYTNVPSDPRYQFVRRDPEPAPPPPARPGPLAGALATSARAFAQLIRAAAERYGVDVRLVEAVVQVESAGNPGAVSPKGAQGLMQLMPDRAAELGVRNAFDPAQNIDGGVRHLRDLLQRFGGDVSLALAAYNAGEMAVRSYGGIPPFTETREYVRRVRQLYDGAGVVTQAAFAAPPPPPAPQQIYREETADGTVIFTNLPPRPGAASKRF